MSRAKKQTAWSRRTNNIHENDGNKAELGPDGRRLSLISAMPEGS
jgi:hypothetical protein